MKDPETVKTITFTPDKLARLIKAYNQAVADGKEDFVFEGHPLVTGYAKYLIEHLENMFSGRYYAESSDG